MDSEALPTDSTAEENFEKEKVIAKEKHVNGETILHTKEEENTAKEANLDTDCTTNIKASITQAQEKSNDKNEGSIVEDGKKDTEENDLSCSVVLPAKSVQEEKSHKESHISISSEERDTVHDETEKKQERSTPEFSPESEENKEHVKVEEIKSEAAKDRVIPELDNELKGRQHEAIGNSTTPCSTIETEDTVEEPVSIYTNAQPMLKETAGFSQDEKIVIENSEFEVALKEVDIDAGLSDPPTAADLVQTGEETKDPEDNFTDDKQKSTTEVEGPVTEEVNEVDFATKIVDASTKEESTNKNLEAVKVEDKSLENNNENSLETTNPVKVVSSSDSSVATEADERVEGTRYLEAIITVDKQETIVNVEEQALNMPKETVIHASEIPTLVIPTETSSGSTSETGTVQESKEKKIEDNKKDGVTEVEKQFPRESNNATSDFGTDEETKDLEAKPEDCNAPTEVEKYIPHESNATLAIVTTEETREVETEVADDMQEVITEVEKQFPCDSTNATSPIGVDEETEELKVEIADDTEEAATEVKQQLPTVSSVATSATINVEEATEIGVISKDEEQEVVTDVEKQFPSGSSTATLAVEVDERIRELEVKHVCNKQEIETEVEQQAPTDSPIATSAILTAEKTREIEHEVAGDKQEVATEIEKEFQIDIGATPAIGTDMETREQEAKLEEDIQEVAIKVEKHISTEPSDAIPSIVTDKEARDVEDRIEGKEVPSESSISVSAIRDNEETKELQRKLEDGNQEVTKAVMKPVPTESSEIASTIVPAFSAGGIEAKIEDDKQAAIEVEKPVRSESSTATSIVGTDEVTRELEVKLEDDAPEAAVEVEKPVPSKSIIASSTVGIDEVTRELEVKLADHAQEAATEVEKPVPSESSTASSTLGTDEVTRELEVKLADDAQEVSTKVENQISADSNGATPAIIVAEETGEIEGKIEDKQEVAKEVEEQVPSDSTTGVAEEKTRKPEAELADENQEGATEVEKQAQTESSGSTSAIVIAKGAGEMEDDQQGTEVELENQVPTDSNTAISATATYEGTQEAEVQIADDKQEAVTEVVKQVPTEFNSTVTVVITEETRELETKIDDDEQEAAIELADDDSTATSAIGAVEEVKLADDKNQEAAAEHENHVLTKSNNDTSAIAKAEETREVEAKNEDDKQETTKDVANQVHGDCRTATSAIETVEVIRELENRIVGNEEGAATEAEKESPTDSCSTSTTITAEEIRETEADIEDVKQEEAIEIEKQAPRNSSIVSSVIGTHEETGDLGAKLADVAQEVAAEVEKQVLADASGDTSPIVSAEETRELEVKLEDDKPEAAVEVEKVPTELSNVASANVTVAETTGLEAKTKGGTTEVEKQVQSESISAISTIRTVEEARELEGIVTDGKPEYGTVTEKQVLNQTNEADATGQTIQVSIEEEKDILPVEMVDGNDNTLDSADKIHTEIRKTVKEGVLGLDVPDALANASTHGTAQSKVEVIHVKQDTPIEVEEPSVSETNKIGMSTDIPAIGATEETREAESKVEDNKQEAVTEVCKQVPSDFITSTSAIETSEETRELEAKVVEHKQEEEIIVDKQVVNQANEAHATSEIAEVSIKEEDDIVIVEMVDRIRTENLNPVKDDTADNGMPEPVVDTRIDQSPNVTSVLLAADELTYRKVDVIDEKKDAPIKIEEPLVAETNKTDSGSAAAEIPLEEETAHVSIEHVEDKKDYIVEDKTSVDNLNDANIVVEISENAFKEVKGPEDNEMVSRNDDSSQIIGTDVNNERSKDDTVILDDSLKILGNGTQIGEVALNRSSEGFEIINEQKENMNLDKVSLLENFKEIAASHITEVSTELEKSPDVVEKIQEITGGNIECGKSSSVMTSKDNDLGSEVAEDLEKSPTNIEIVDNTSENSEIKKTILDAMTKLADENADISKILSAENEGPEVVQDTKEEKDYEGSITKENMDDNMESKEGYIKTLKDLDIKQESATATSDVSELVGDKITKGSSKEETEKRKDENLDITPRSAEVVVAPKSADVETVEVSSKQDISTKPSPRRSNNIISKVKHSIVKAKKAIMGKSPTPKDASQRSKEEIK